MKIYLKKQLPVSAVVYLGQFMCGYTGGWISPVLPRLQDPEQTTLPEPITETQASLIGSFLYLGVLFGTFFAGFCSHEYGRKACFIISSGFVLGAQILVLTSVNVAMMIAGRTIIGFGVGAIFNVVIVYLTDIASTNIRGVLLTGTGFFTSFGTLLAFCIVPYLPIPVTIYIGIFMVIVFVVGVFFIPESPVFKILQGKEEEAKQILETLGRNDDVKDIIVLKLKDKDDPKTKYSDIITVKGNRRALFTLVTLFTLQSMSGAIAMLSYATSIFQLANMNLDPNISTIIVGITLLVSSCVSPMLVEYTGRRILLIVSSSCCFICQVVMGVYFFLEDGNYPVVESLRWLPLVTMVSFFIAFNSGLAIIPSTLIGEMFASEIRSLGSAVTFSCGWFFVFVSAVTYGYMVTALGAYFTFWMYSGFCCAAFIVSVIFVPETKGKTLIEIQDMLNK